MVRPRISYVEVAQCAQQFIARGDEPTIERIRAQLKTGSNSTIGAHLRTWRARQDPLHQLATREKIPEKLIMLLKGLWERIIAQAENQLETFKNETQLEKEQTRQTLQQYHQDNACLQQAQIQLKQANNSLIQEKSTLGQLLTQVQTERAVLKTQQEGLRQQLTDQQTRVEELHRQNQQIQANLEHYQASSLEQRRSEQQRTEQQQRQMEQTLHQLKTENEKLRQQKIALQQTLERVEIEHSQAKDQIEKINIGFKETLSALTETKQHLTLKIEAQQYLQTQYDKLQTQSEKQNSLIIDLQVQCNLLSQQTAALQIKLENITEQNKVISNDKWILGQEKAQLYGQLKQLESSLRT